jgi:hypothetical protein
LLAQKLSQEQSNFIEIRKTEQSYENYQAAINPATDPRVNRRVRAFLRRRLDSALGFVILACFLTAASSARAEQPDFITALPAISPVAASTQAQGPLEASADLNQAAMSQIINQLNQSKLQLRAAAAETSAQRSMFEPQTISIRRAK